MSPPHSSFPSNPFARVVIDGTGPHRSPDAFMKQAWSHRTRCVRPAKRIAGRFLLMLACCHRPTLPCRCYPALAPMTASLSLSTVDRHDIVAFRSWDSIGSVVVITTRRGWSPKRHDAPVCVAPLWPLRSSHRVIGGRSGIMLDKSTRSLHILLRRSPSYLFLSAAPTYRPDERTKKKKRTGSNESVGSRCPSGRTPISHGVCSA